MPFRVGFFQAFAQRNRISHRRQTTPDGAFANANENIALASKLFQHFDVFGIAATAFNQAQVTLLGEFFDVIQGRFVELDQFHHFEQLEIGVQHRHVTTETTGQRNGGDRFFLAWSGRRFAFGLHPVAAAD